jgi:hypothetical protein
VRAEHPSILGAMRRPVRRLAAAALALAAAALPLAGCGGGSAGPVFTSVAKPRVFALADFKPSGPVKPGREVRLSFFIRQPSGKPLVDYKRGPGPHTGIHVILVRDDLASIIHRHPIPDAGGSVDQPVTFPAPGRYRLVVDAYPNLTGQLRNFQLFKTITVTGPTVPIKLPPFQARQVVEGYTFTMHGRPALKAIQAGFLTITVTDPQGKPAPFTPYYGALAHAIFFRQGSLDYFHTHVCGPGAQGCTSALGATKVTGVSSRPGVLRVGVLVPVPGTWRLFLQTQVQGHLLTVPFTLEVTA